MTKSRWAGSTIALLALLGVATIGLVTPTPAQARVFVGFGPFWGYPAYPYAYPYPYPYPAPYPYYAPPPVVYTPPPVDPGYAPADPGYAAPPAAPAAAPGNWYYCNSPAGYYPYVKHCKTGWRAVPAQPQE